MDCFEFDRTIAKGVNPESRLDLPGFPRMTNHAAVPLVVAGVDEAGRGPLAGPVVASAVVLPESLHLTGLRDSKVVPREQREALFSEIKEKALSFSIKAVGAAEIDQINILQATMKAMREAIRSVHPGPNVVLVDGNQKPGSGFPEMALIKGDGKSAAIMAASILAKVTRDQMMTEFHRAYPQYGFDGHKGYGSARHIEALRNYGPCPIHRRSFEPVKSLVREKMNLLS